MRFDTGAGRQLKFDLDEFCRRFKLQRQQVYYSIIYMERTGHLTFSEDVDINTKVQIVLGRNDLYDLSLNDVKMESLLDLLMRRYTGVFSYPVPVDEEYLSSRLGVTVPALRQLLYGLSIQHIIRYIPCDHATVIFLHHDRLRPGNLNLDPQRYDLLKSSALERMQKMIDYVQEEDVCRSTYLLEYFGQSESADCGTCDICRGAAKNGESALVKSLTSYIMDEKSGRYTISDISARFGSADKAESDSYLTLLRRLIDEGKVPAPYSQS